MINMCDGKNDGIVLMYCKKGVIYPVALGKEQLEILDTVIGVMLKNGLQIIKDMPQGQLKSIGGVE
ncbi:hypothetical protein EXM31_09930 [Clostridium botulinum]|nr:hypothetical protein [Clostridium botulinum]NFA39621.1 hypothetical protein [Clostridium botulinum]NFE26038.1 hypothetical protein [Clostridium botulinum]